MSYIREIEPDDAPEEVSRIYDRLRERFEGRVPNVLKVVSLRPRAMEALFELNMAVTFGGSGLTRVQEEAIATAVSAINHCEY